MKKVALKVVPLFVRWGSLALMVFAIYTFVSNTLFLIQAETTTGIVVAQKKSNSIDSVRTQGRISSAASYAPSITFRTSTNEEVTFLSNFGYDEGISFELGEEVSVLYRTSDPQSAQIYNLFEMFALPVILFLFFGFFYGMGVLMRAVAETLGEGEKPDSSKV